MSKKLIAVFVILAFAAIAGNVPKAGVYKITLFERSAVNNTQLQPGEYKLVVGDSKITISLATGGKSVEIPARVENVEKKFATTVVTAVKTDSLRIISEIDLGGTTTKLVFAQ